MGKVVSGCILIFGLNLGTYASCTLTYENRRDMHNGIVHLMHQQPSQLQ